MASTKQKQKNQAVTQRPKRPNRSLAKNERREMTDAELRELYIQVARIADDPVKLLSVDLYKRVHEGKITEKEDKTLADKIFIALGFETDNTVALTVKEKYRGLAIELRRQIIKDLDCKTYTEKVVVDAVVSAYIRTLRFTEAMTANMEDRLLFSDNTNYMAMLSKELDRANRHLLAAYQTLIQLKQPPLKVQVKAQNAFIGQAQQFNVNKEEPSYEQIVTP